MSDMLHVSKIGSMLRSTKLLLSAVLAVGMVVGLSAPAFADTSRYICLQNTSQRCLDNPANGGNVQIDGGYQWTEHTIGTIGNQVNFTGSSSHFNTMFAGNTVIQAQNSSGTNCIRTDASSPSALTTGGCGQGAYLIEHGGYLVDFSETQQYNDENILETSNANKGTVVEVFVPVTGYKTNWNY